MKKDRKTELINEFCRNNSLSLPPLGQRHFLTHLNEFSAEALDSALSQAPSEDGVWEIEVTQGWVLTRLWGPKVGNPSLKEEERVMVERGQGRPPQPIIHRSQPWQSTDIITVIIHGGVLVTIHGGPSMPLDFEDALWATHALAYREGGI